MVNFYQAEKKAPAAKAFEVTCSALDIQGRGVCKHEGRVYFVEDLLPGEVARIVPQLSAGVTSANAAKEKVATAKVSKYILTSPLRQEDSCPLQQQCGGCPLAYMPAELALKAKVAGVAKLLTKSVLQGTMEAKSSKASTSHGSSKLGKNSTIKQALAAKQAQAKNIARQKELQALTQEAAAAVSKASYMHTGAELGYRRACRLAVRTSHGRLYLGFREGKTQELVPVSSCAVLTPRLNALLEPLQSVVNTLEGKKNLGHVELLDTDGAAGVLLRLTKKAESADVERLQAFAAEHHVVLSLLEPFKQLDDTEVVRERLLYDEGAEAAVEAAATEANTNGELQLSSALYVQSGDCKVYCSPSSFVQVNAAMNSRMVQQVLTEVEPHEGQKVLDLFSGLGNFALPIAKGGSEVVGIDIVSDMVRRATYNAQANGVADRARFYTADLESPFEAQLWAKDQYDVVVMDPGRMGAKRAVQYVAKLQPKKIVMISCNPLAAARDCSQLLAAHYKIQSWGAFDMFPRTRHIEILLVFTRESD